MQLCAACKTRTADTVAASAALAIDVFGENHVQELCANYDAGAYCGKPSHFIGHLQTNKIKKVLGRASLIQSVDSEHLLAAIEKEAAKAGIVQDVLLEVNIGGEESKSGVSPEQLWPLLDAAAAEEHIRVKGLMAIPPVNDDDAQNRRYLAQVYKLFVQAGERGYQNVKMETLSMGMSGDFENAIREGATLVRIGTAIYGERIIRRSNLSVSLRSTAPLSRGASGEEVKLYGMPKPPLVRSNNDDRRQRRKQGVAVGAAASRMRGPHQGPKQMLGAATRAVARRRRDGEV